MIHEILVVGLFQCNCSILGCEETREAMVVDPGDDAERILMVLNRLDLRLKSILHTHAHFDHIGGTRRLKEETGAAVYLHPEDLFLYNNVGMQTAFFGLDPLSVPPVDASLVDGEMLSAGKVGAQVFHTPGHTPGSACFHFDAGIDRSPGKVFTGDTLFKDGIGRTDLWGGSHPTLLDSIHERLLSLPEDTLVYPGHGPATTIGREREWNPFLQ